MIRISLGNPGSGKTLCEVRDMILNRTGRVIYTNIIPKQPKLTPHIRTINKGMIVKEEIIGYKNKKDGSSEPIKDLKLNVEFWKEHKEPVSVVLDEVHNIMNARRSMSKQNIITTDFLALLRRVLGQGDSGYGELVLISQLSNRIDIIAREMATQVRYHVCHYMKTCRKCGQKYKENSETSEQLYKCETCGSFDLLKHGHYIEVWCFQNMESYETWKSYGQKTYGNHYYVTDVEKFFKYYNTLQWEDMLSEN